MKYVIYGAQSIALGIILCYRDRITGVLVSSMEGNPKKLDGIPVSVVGDFAATLSQSEKDEILVLIATPESVQPEIEEILENNGFYYHRGVTSEEYAEAIERYYIRKNKLCTLKSLPIGIRKPFIRTFIAKSEKDRPLRNSFDFPQWTLPLQVGASFSLNCVAALSDNSGDNISERNSNYSELTGLYWVWKNKLQNGIDKNQYYGFMQYRRFLNISDVDILRLQDNNVDVVLPYPMQYAPDISIHHKRYVSDEDWEAVVRAINELHPEYVEIFDCIMKKRDFYNYNIILAKRNILRDYCAWLFPILEYVENLRSYRGRSDRYIGYIGESLETLYFIANKERFFIAHTGCKFLL